MIDEQLYRLTRTILACWVVAVIAFAVLALATIHQQVTPLFAFTWERSEFLGFIWTLGALAIPFFILGALAEHKQRSIELAL
jgi:Kef-type K+ transport system membrane component KefB